MFKILLFLFVFQVRFFISNGAINCSPDGLNLCFTEFLTMVTPMGIFLTEKWISSACLSVNATIQCVMDFEDQCIANQSEPLLAAISSAKENILELCQPDSNTKQSVKIYESCYQNSNESFVNCYNNHTIHTVTPSSTAETKWKAACCDYHALATCASKIECGMLPGLLLKAEIEHLHGIAFQLACKDIYTKCNITEEHGLSTIQPQTFSTLTTNEQKNLTAPSIETIIDKTAKICGPETVANCVSEFLLLVNPDGINLTEQTLQNQCVNGLSAPISLEVFNYHCTSHIKAELESSINRTILFITEICKQDSEFMNAVKLHGDCFVKVSDEFKQCFDRTALPDTTYSEESKRKTDCCRYKGLKSCATQTVMNTCGQPAAKVIQEEIEFINGVTLEVRCKEVFDQCNSAFRISVPYFALLIMLGFQSYLILL